MFYLNLFLLLLCSAAGKKVIAVMGATGMQGGGVVDALLSDGTFACRAITRSVSSEKARALAERGCEVVEGDMDKPDSLKLAFEGAEGAFLVTNYWETQDTEKEYRQAIGAAEAAHAAGVKHIVWSTLEPADEHDSVRNVMQKIGDYKLPQFASKAKANHYMKSKMLPVTYLFTCFYMDNFYLSGLLKRVDDSHYEIVMPTTHEDTKFSLVSLRDLGLMALSAFKDPTNTINQDVKVMSDFLTPREIGAQLEKATGIKVAVKQPKPLEFAQFGFPGAPELGNMFQYDSEYEDVWSTYSRVQNYDNFESFLERNAQVLKDYITKLNNKAAAEKKRDL